MSLPRSSHRICIIGCMAPAIVFLLTSVGTAELVLATADTTITTHSNLGGPSATLGSDPLLWSIGPSSFRSHPLVQFDLSHHEGRTVVGTPQVELWLNGGHPSGNGDSRSIGVHQILIAWDESTTSYANFGASSGIQIGSDVTAALNTSEVIWPDTGARYVSWELPLDLLQQWIDHPGSNRGLAFVDTSGRDLTFSAREGDMPPRLVFETVPEPTSLSLLCFGILLALHRFFAVVGLASKLLGFFKTFRWELSTAAGRLGKK